MFAAIAWSSLILNNSGVLSTSDAFDGQNSADELEETAYCLLAVATKAGFVFLLRLKPPVTQMYCLSHLTCLVD